MPTTSVTILGTIVVGVLLGAFLNFPQENAPELSLAEKSRKHCSYISEFNYTMLGNVHTNHMLKFPFEGFKKELLSGTPTHRSNTETFFALIISECSLRITSSPILQDIHKEMARCNADIKLTAHHMMKFDDPHVGMKDIAVETLDDHARFMLGLDVDPNCHAITLHADFKNFCANRNKEIIKLGQDGALGGVNSDVKANFAQAQKLSEDFRTGITHKMYTQDTINQRTAHFKLCAVTHINSEQAMKEQQGEWDAWRTVQLCAFAIATSAGIAFFNGMIMTMYPFITAVSSLLTVYSMWLCLPNSGAVTAWMSNLIIGSSLSVVFLYLWTGCGLKMINNHWFV